ncbi:MAG TPA: FGGY-family carbohydrate kinase [Clostridia bacterium]|nr:FGGY-family carbohydrate kinase [Clostridia bacterium]
MGQQYLLGLDNGGTVTKAALYGTDGAEIAVSAKQVKPIMEKVGFVERDMTELWQANAAAIRDVLADSAVNPKDIIGVAVTGHGCGAYFIDAEGKPAANGIISTDTRAKEYVERWNADGTYDKLLPMTMQIIWAGQTLPIVAWHRDNRPDVLARAERVLSCKDYIRFCLTGEAYTELTDVSVANGINLNTIAYDDAIFDAFGIGDYKRLFAPLKKCTDVCGTVSEQAARETGLIAGTPVAGGLCDVAACCIGTGVTSPDKMCMVAGTWSINEFLSERPIASMQLFQNALYCMDDYWMILENSMTSASNLEWFIKNLMGQEKQEAEGQGASVFQTTDAMVSSIQPENCPVVFLPFLFGTNVNADAKACFLGISGLHTKAHMLRAVYEGVAFSHRTHMENLLRFRERPSGIRISGGAARSRVWVQIFADVFQIPVEVSAGKELGTMGAAMCAGIAAGAFGDFIQAVDVFSKVAYTCLPNPAMAEIYEGKFRLYSRLSRTLDETWKDWDTVFGK